jgi:hypothetical protein
MIPILTGAPVKEPEAADDVAPVDPALAPVLDAVLDPLLEHAATLSAAAAAIVRAGSTRLCCRLVGTRVMVSPAKHRVAANRGWCQRRERPADASGRAISLVLMMVK